MDFWIVVKFAVFTRVLALLLQAIFNALIPDHAADAFRPPRLEEPLLLDPLADLLLSGLSRWDAEHFIFIAERGYVYEHNFAFFPLFPLLLRAVAWGPLCPLCRWLTRRGRLLVAIALTNSVLSLAAAVMLWCLGRAVLQERRTSLLASLLFCISPAGVFFSAGYSESLFASLTFGGLWLLQRGRTLCACLILSLASATRSNGLVSAGFLLYLPLQRGITQAISNVENGPGRVFRYTWITLHFLLTVTLGMAAIFIPFIAFQYYGYLTFCKPSLTEDQVPHPLLELAHDKGYRIPDMHAGVPSWCHSQPPLLYSYIQDTYWNVGFLRYFQLKQAPNFLLALPVILLGIAAAWSYLSANPALCLRLAMGKDHSQAFGYHNPKVFVYLVHFAFLLVFGTFCMHVQVVTRFLASSSPVLYWFCAHLLQYESLKKNRQLYSHEENKQQHKSTLSTLLFNIVSCNPLTRLLVNIKSCSLIPQCLLGYFLSYWLLGLVLHTNFLPWT